MSNSTTHQAGSAANTPAGQESPRGPTMEQIKAKMKATWEDGDYASFCKYMQDGAIEILESWNLEPGQRLLDIGCGSGQTAIPAAHHGLDVTGIDIAENLVEFARERAIYEGLKVRFDVGDAEDLPYEDNSFDVVISMIGAMFAPQPDKVVSEIARVLKPGGKLYMVNWTPASVPAKMFKAVASVTPPPPGFIPPVLWGDEKTVQQRLSSDFGEINLNRMDYPQWSYPFDVNGVVDLFRTHFGPVKNAFNKLENEKADTASLHGQLSDIFHNSSEKQHDGKLKINDGELLQIIATYKPALN